MAWAVRSDAVPGRYVAWNGDGLDADADTRRDLEGWARMRASFPVTVTGPFHEVAGLDDELGMFLLATQTDAVPTPRTVTGTPPTARAAAVPAGATA